jgi:hypothetical protein
MPAFITAGASLLGGYLSGKSAEKAARTRADAELKAAQLAAEEARFRPVGITTRFGTSDFQTDANGRVIGANYSLDPALRAYQNRFMDLAGGGLSQAEQAQGQYAPLGSAAQGLFKLGGQYIAESPEQAAQKYMLGQQDLVAPSRERQLAGIRTNLFNTGRTGLSVGATGTRPGGGGGLGASSPELEAYYNAVAQEDARLAAGATEAGQRQSLFGADLYRLGGNLGTQNYGLQAAAIGPYEAYLGQMQKLEALGQQPLDLGINIGAKGQSTGAAQALLSGGMNAAESRFRADAYNPFATAFTQASMNPDLRRGIEAYRQPYESAKTAINQYGAENVYGYGGGGTVPMMDASIFGSADRGTFY